VTEQAAKKTGTTRRPKRKKKALKTPAAVRVFREQTHRFPAKSWWSTIVKAVGEKEADLQYWGAVVFFWVGAGWNPVNAVGMLQFYRKGELPTMPGYGRTNWRAAMALVRGDDAGAEPVVVVEETQEPVHIRI